MNQSANAHAPNIPQAAVSSAIFHGGRVLLVLRGREPSMGLWSLPGGHIRPGETAEAAARRELREETGVEAEFYGPAAIRDVIQQTDRREVLFHRVIIVFCGLLASGRVRAGSDAADARWFAPDEIAALGATDGLAESAAQAEARLRLLGVYQ